MLAATHSAPVRSSAARAAHRELRSLLRLFRANYACGICARTPWRMARYRVVQTSASRAVARSYVCFGPIISGDLRASALAHGAISRRTNKAVARVYHRRDWPETNVGASAARDAPRGRRSISQTPEKQRRPPPPQPLLSQDRPVAAPPPLKPPYPASWQPWEEPAQQQVSATPSTQPQ